MSNENLDQNFNTFTAYTIKKLWFTKSKVYRLNVMSLDLQSNTRESFGKETPEPRGILRQWECDQVNPFCATEFFLHALKTSGNERFFYIFRECRKTSVPYNGLNNLK